MDVTTQQQLIDEILALKTDKSLFLDESVNRRAGQNYCADARFDAEKQNIFRKLPHAVAHMSELQGAGAFKRAAIAGVPLLLTRDKEGVLRAFRNICRHRSMRLVEADSGCAHRFTCPYHAWTYSNSGEFLAGPHFEAGFGELDKSDLALAQLFCVERFGFIWVSLEPMTGATFDAYFADMAKDLEACDIASLEIKATTSSRFRANWKILSEGGLEAYHFKVAHRKTIGPYFEDNLSTYQSMGSHIRSVLPRVSMQDLAEAPREDWRLRDHANLLYTLFPTTQLLVQQDHVVWIRSNPLSAGETELTMTTLGGDQNTAGDSVDSVYWQKNQEITVSTLKEDFDIGEAIQAGIEGTGDLDVYFGRFEGALDLFNRTVESCLPSQS